MPVNDEVRRLSKKWGSGAGWGKRLEWLEVKGIRGWNGQRLDFSYPITAIVGENGSGKSTLLRACAVVYRSSPQTRYASEFFPDTAWDEIRNATLRFGYAQGQDHHSGSIRKPTTRWLGNVDRPERPVEYVDLSRIQSVATRVGYARIAKTRHTEASSTPFDEKQVQRLSSVMGRAYDSARMALATIDAKREIPVISKENTAYSGFHQGSGETTIAELLRVKLPKNSLLLIDEIESSLHPRAQRRLIRDLADHARELELQIILTTHSPYVLEELPLEARKYILETETNKEIFSGVSPQFAMTKMDDEQHPECDLFVEDQAANTMLAELLAYHAKEVFPRCQIIPFGAASVGYALGQMVEKKSFPRPSLVFLDGDVDAAPGCLLLPGGDAPEQVVFRTLKARNWANLWTRIGRDVSLVSDACDSAMTLSDHHDWVRVAANKLMCGGATLWQAMCAEWARTVAADDAKKVVQPIEDLLS
jgi:predicted ATPase